LIVLCARSSGILAQRNASQRNGVVRRQRNDPDVIAVTGAPLPPLVRFAFCYSIAAVLRRSLNGQLVAIQPSPSKRQRLNIVMRSEEAIMMVEAGSLEVSEDTVVEASNLPRANQGKFIAAIKELKSN